MGGLDTAGVEKGDVGVEGQPAKFISNELFNYQILDLLLPLHEEWVGQRLEPTAVYGIRVYQTNSTMIDHLDVLSLTW